MSNNFTSQNDGTRYMWAGISCLVSTMLIVAAGFLQRFMSLPPTDGSGY